MAEFNTTSIKEMIEILSTLNENAAIVIFNENTQELYGVKGWKFSESKDDNPHIFSLHINDLFSNKTCNKTWTTAVAKDFKELLSELDDTTLVVMGEIDSGKMFPIEGSKLLKNSKGEPRIFIIYPKPGHEIGDEE